jgi:hypothetical protein
MMMVQTAPTSKSILGQWGYTSRTYTSQGEGIRFQYPAQWGEAMDSYSSNSDCHKSGCFISFVIRDPLSKSNDVFIIRIDSQNLNSGMQESCNCKTLTDFVRWDYDQKFSKDNYIIIQNQTKVNTHHNAWQMELSSTTEKEATQRLLVWTIDGNTGYRIQYSAPPYRFTEYLDGFEGILKSFTFPEQSKPIKQSCLLFNFVCF